MRLPGIPLAVLPTGTARGCALAALARPPPDSEDNDISRPVTARVCPKFSLERTGNDGCLAAGSCCAPCCKSDELATLGRATMANLRGRKQ